jgi:hypothetical protein
LPDSPRSSLRPTLQALFFLFHCTAVAVLSIPPPPPGMKGAAGDAEVAGAVRAWGEAVEGLGIDADWFVGVVHRSSTAWGGVLAGLQAPFRPYADVTGATQSWRMFGVVPAQVGQLEIDVHRDGAWEPLYRPRSAEAAWSRRLLAQERTRALVHPFTQHRRHRTWRKFASWLAARARDEGVPGDRIRLRLRRLAIPPPAELRQTGTLTPGEAFWAVEEEL